MWKESVKYINSLIIPKGYEIDIHVIEDAKSIAEGYNRGMKASNAKYKVYMHHDVFLINPNLLEQSIEIFMQHPEVGIMGVAGCKRLPLNGIWWEGQGCIGGTLEDNLECLKQLQLGDVDDKFEEVQALDGQFLMTQYDIEWREDICKGWHFYDSSQCLEFGKVGYQAVVIKQEQPWLIHECGMDVNNGYEEERDRFLIEYRQQIEKRNYLTEEEIGQLINTGEYKEAMERLLLYKESAAYNDNMSIFEGSLLFGDRKEKEAFSCIAKGLSYNCRNYELYFMLGNYYQDKNPNQAYLCYENAEFYCNNNDREFITNIKEELFQSGQVCVKPVSVVILSYNCLELTALCIDSLRETMSSHMGEIIVIDNASTDGSAEWLKKRDAQEQEKSQTGHAALKIICNQENVGFPKGCNQGILVSDKENDIFLLNNDTIVPPNALFYLRMGLYEDPKVASVGSVSNHANNDQIIKAKKASTEAWYKYGEEHNIPMQFPYEKKAWLMGFAVMFKRQILEEIGYLDEAFTPGNYEDNDIGYRILKAGYTQLLCKNSFIFHFGSIGFRKDQKAFDALLQRNRMILARKHGYEIDSYSWVRTDLIKYIQADMGEALQILDVGCGLGATVVKIESLYPYSRVTGVEKDDLVAKIGANIADIRHGDIESMDLDFEKHSLDYILIGNVIEYLSNPRRTLVRLAEYLKESGMIIISISKGYMNRKENNFVGKNQKNEIYLKSEEYCISKIESDNPDSIDYLFTLRINNQRCDT